MNNNFSIHFCEMRKEIKFNINVKLFNVDFNNKWLAILRCYKSKLTQT